jgi:hypothetical protein
MKKNHQLGWTPQEKKILTSLHSPAAIQEYLNSLKYNIDSITRSARGVLQSRKAHCFDGALLAAAALEFHGSPALLMDLRSNGEDDDHVLALFKRKGCWGAVAKSNFIGTRYRDPVYRSLRELAMSYFHIYFNLKGKKTLREYSVVFSLSRISKIDWRWGADDMTPLGEQLDGTRHYFLISSTQERLLTNADPISIRSETLVLDKRGAFKVT